MTRINCVPVEALTNEHLMAEYKESTRPFTKVIASMEKGRKVPALDGAYRLSTGHETFFFNKLYWLYNRRVDILHELKKRNFNIDMQKFTEIANIHKAKLSHTIYWNDWQPTPEDMYVNMARLCHRHFKTDLSEFN